MKLLSMVLLCVSGIALGQPAPCTLLTQDQLTKVIGSSAGAAAPIANSGCSWKAGKVTVTVSMQNAKMFEGAKRGSTTSAAGVGDESFFTGVENFASIWARKGSIFVLVRLYGLPVSEAQPKLTTLAKNVVSKL